MYLMTSLFINTGFTKRFLFDSIYIYINKLRSLSNIYSDNAIYYGYNYKTLDDSNMIIGLTTYL